MATTNTNTPKVSLENSSEWLAIQNAINGVSSPIARKEKLEDKKNSDLLLSFAKVENLVEDTKYLTRLQKINAQISAFTKKILEQGFITDEQKMIAMALVEQKENEIAKNKKNK